MASEISTREPQKDLSALLAPHRKEIAAQWIALVQNEYPFETIGFLRTVNDRFANPVGHRTEAAANALVNAVFDKKLDDQDLGSALEELMRVRAIQSFSPETAVGIIFAMKDLIRQVVIDSGEPEKYVFALLELETYVDALSLRAFGVYAKCRENMHLLKVDEVKRRYAQVVRYAQRKGLINMEEADTHKP